MRNPNRTDTWTAAEIRESLRNDTTVEEIATALGRSPAAVVTSRSRYNRESDYRDRARQGAPANWVAPEKVSCGPNLLPYPLHDHRNHDRILR